MSISQDPREERNAEPTRDEPSTAIPPASADGQDQDGPRGHGGKTFLEHARESMEEHDALGRLLTQ